MNVKVTEIQRFCMHDGPGIRTTVFLKGCPLRCVWCHNPETQKSNAELLFYPQKCIGCGMCIKACPVGAHQLTDTHEISRAYCILCESCANSCPTGALAIMGKEMTVSEILKIVEKDLAFYGEDGGITLSGGEPFLQEEATVALLKGCKEKGISTAVETCGYADPDILRAALPYVDTLLWDLKDTDDMRHRHYTGVSNERILENLRIANEAKSKIRLRCILINGINTNQAHYKKIAEIANALHRIEGVELIPYHAYGGVKATFIGKNDNGNVAWIPEASQIEGAKRFLIDCGVFVF